MNELYVAWRDPAGRSWFPVGRVSFDGSSYEFVYLAGAHKAAEVPGFPGLPEFPQLDRRYVSDRLFYFLKNRVISRNRGDYWDRAQRLGLNPGEHAHSIHEFEILERSNGIRVTDRFQLFASPIVDKGYATFLFFSRGFRYLNKTAQLHWSHETPDGKLRAMIEPGNEFDSHAVALFSHDLMPLGFVPRYYSESIASLLRSGANASFRVTHSNSEPAPAQERFLVKATIEVPDDWKFPTSDDFCSLATDEQGDLSASG